MIRYNQVKGIKKSGSTDQSNHRFPSTQQHIAIDTFHYTYLFRLCQVVKNPKTKKEVTIKGMPICGHGTPDTLLESCTRYRLKVYKEPFRNQNVKKSNPIISLRTPALSGLSI